ncbi:hypothetical protein N7541_006704 [Penicillium brevicompactum]|uniref:NmrA-like domain-containing protein n=1 Tax=Penicillium brevicompactum TaxID=5074 RepID=A0A9W9R5Q4_PENBR|nr:hypothetical protein N7541_006704 [Penicillium brevicompactum]
MSSRIGIFPAVGGLGGSTARHLLALRPTQELVYIARHPQKLEAEQKAGVEVRRADYDDDATLSQAFNGVDTLFLISYASCEYEHRARAHVRAIDAAIKSGVKHIFYASLGYAGEKDKKSIAWVMRAHLYTEAYLEKLARERSNFTYTAVREGLYSESFGLYTSGFDLENPTKEIKIPHDGSGPGIAWVKRDELGEGTAKLIKQYADSGASFPYVNKTILLSGSQTLTMKETIDILGQVANIEPRIREVSHEEFAAQPANSKFFTYRGMDFSKDWATTLEAFKLGESAVVTPLLKELLGREPESFETTVRAMV